MNETLQTIETMIKCSRQDRILAKGILSNLKFENKQDNQIKINLRIIIDLLARPHLPRVYPNAWVKQWFEMNIEQTSPWGYRFKNNTDNEKLYFDHFIWDANIWHDKFMSGEN